MCLTDSQSVPLTAGPTANTKPHIHAHFSKVRAARPTKTACKNAEVPTASVYHYLFYKKKKDLYSSKQTLYMSNALEVRF